MTSIGLISIAAALAAFKLGALALAATWGAQTAFSPQGLLTPARSHSRRT